MPEPITLEVFSDYVCPWCYLGDNRVKKIKADYDINVQLVHFPLHPDTPAEGRARDDFKAKNPAMKARMEAEGLVGARPLEALVQFMAEIGAQRRTADTSV